MLGKAECERILNQVINTATDADEAEVLIFTNESGLTRFANNYIHQNVVERNATIHLRLIYGKKIGISSTNNLSNSSIESLVQRAKSIAQHSDENPEFVGLPSDNSPIEQIDVFKKSTEKFKPEQRAKEVAKVIENSKKYGLVASGAFETGLREIAIKNTKGIYRYQSATVADFSTIIMSENSSGYANSSAIDVYDINVEQLANEAIEKALKSKDPIELSPGEYTVILEEYAVATLVNFLAYLGFNGLAWYEGRSFLNEKQNQKISVDNFSIWDDGCDKRGLAQPFDFEGVPKKRVDLIKNGYACNPVLDHHIASKTKLSNTGHALPAPNTIGPIPMHIYMAPGNVDKQNLLDGIKKGIWVTRFHYVNCIHPKNVILTGMTRDGTFLIEDGKITTGVKNLRFTVNVIDALSKIEAIGNSSKCFISNFGTTMVSPLRISAFNFSGVTTF